MAVYVPDPERTIDQVVEDLATELADRYRDVEDELIRQIAVRAQRDFALSAEADTVDVRARNRVLAELAAHRSTAVRELQAIAVGMVERLRTAGLSQRLVEAAALEGEAAAAHVLGYMKRLTDLPMLTGTATQATAMLALNLQSRLEVLNQRITRYPRDAYQRIVAMYSPQTILGTVTAREQQARTVQRFLAEGINGFQDRSGRWWRVGSYAEMAGRTSVARAFNDAGVWRMQQSGVNLGTITGAGDACKKCAPWIGRIVSFDGTTGPVTVPHATLDASVTINVDASLDAARAAGWGHPNDRCKVVAYSPGLAIPQAGFRYDEAADKARQKQRELERDVRAAKRLEASAMTDTDRQKAARDVRAAQADLRDFTRETGRRRDYAREQLRFADG